MLPQSIDLINSISFFFVRFMAQVVASSHVQVTWAHHCDAPYGLEVMHLWFKGYKFSKASSEVKENKEVQRHSSRCIDIMKSGSDEVNIQLNMQKIKKFKTPFYLVRLHLWWNWTRSIQLKEGETCPHQTLQDPSFQLMHQMRKQELPLKLLKCCRGNNQQQVFLKGPVCQHHLVKLIISKVRG